MKKFIIDSASRKLTPTDQNAAFAVFRDKDTDGVEFELTGDIVSEIGEFPVYINYIVGEDVTVYREQIEDVTISGTTMKIVWKPSRNATQNSGAFAFVLCFAKEDGTEWNTTTYVDRILDGIEPYLTDEETAEMETYYDTLISRLDAYADELKAGLEIDNSWKRIGTSGASGVVDSCIVNLITPKKYKELKIFINSVGAYSGSNSVAGCLKINGTAVGYGFDTTALKTSAKRSFLFEVGLMPDCCITKTMMNMSTVYTSDSVAFKQTTTVSKDTEISAIEFLGGNGLQGTIGSGTRMYVYGR